MRLLVGLTGGLASGKSTVAQLLRELGITVIDADRLVAELYRPGEPGVAAVRQIFGEEMIDQARGGVDRKRLAELVFADPAALRRLEAVIHPLVEHRFLELADSHQGILVIEGTLLVEAGFGTTLDHVVSVESDRATQLRRAVARGMDPAAAEARLVAQGDGESRRAGADSLIDNCGSLDELRSAVSSLADKLRALLIARE